MLKQIIKEDRKILCTLLTLTLLAPTLLCYIFGNIYVEDIPMGIVDNDNSTLSRQIISGFENHPGFELSFIDTDAHLKEMVQSKELSGGIIIPQNFSLDLSSKTPSKVIAIIDGTNLLVGNNTQGYISKILSTFNAGIQLKYLEGKGLLPQTATQTMSTFTFTDRTLYDPYMSYLCYLTYVLIPNLIQMSYVCYFALPLLSKEKQTLFQLAPPQKGFRRYISERIKVLLPRFSLIWGITATSSYVGLCIAAKYFGLPMRGNTLCYFVLLVAFFLALSASSLFLSTFVKPAHTLYFSEFYVIISTVLMITSGAMWPPYLMPHGFFGVVRSLWPYALVATPFKLLNLKGSGWNIITPYIIGCLTFTAAWTIISLGIMILQYKHKQKSCQSCV